MPEPAPTRRFVGVWQQVPCVDHGPWGATRNGGQHGRRAGVVFIAVFFGKVSAIGLGSWWANKAAREYDSAALRVVLKKLGVKVPKAWGADAEIGLGAMRWSMERTLSWLRQFRCSPASQERALVIHQALVLPARIITGRRHLVMYFASTGSHGQLDERSALLMHRPGGRSTPLGTSELQSQAYGAKVSG